ncbi:LTA synthase family protein [Clostridium botulinum]|uniref:LTA synthase family protein n=1 Tax=Clostridium botulinum TaxID=1491 RepID=A0A846J5E8_CLOBO|nr:LTA synthase family protein [Clostridium botulinum]ACA55903.1 sulfatase family protein [Clostridium botulinum A3 str. Loch Maree]NFH64328.1 LTA synthase family protein [Clostridium botulinum]NFJ07093.1 LTA synthase family protein [Clostridium botulinum]NFK14065.1 LTA synthase family protein [Clostridium botulinum]NFM92279.1 LTA synthase family protein [Clostridium botulinum]
MEKALKLKNIVKKIIIRNLDIILFLILVSLKVMFYGKEISPEFFSYKYILLPVVASVGVLLGIGYFLQKHKRTKFLYVLNIIISSIIIADLLYYRYYKDIISIGAIRNAFLLGGVASSITSLFKLKDFVYFLDILLIIPFLKVYRNMPYKENKKIIRIGVGSLILAGAILLNGINIYKLSVDQPGLLNTMSNRIYITKVLGNVNFHVIDAYQFTRNKINNSKKLPEAKEKELVDNFEGKSQIQGEKLKGVGEGKNLIVIQVEALQQFAINAKVEGQEVTPNLNKWINKSMYFDNYFYQVAAGNTSDAEFLSNNSLYPAVSGAAYYMYSGNQFKSLPSTLQDKGYYTAAMHGYKDGFWNRNVMYKAQKFQDFHGESTYNIDEEVGLGLSDKSFFNQSLEKIKTFKQPFYSFLITLSSHFPYDDVKGYGEFNVGKYEGSFLGNYLKGIHYTDAQLGMFLESLEKEGYLDNSIVVIYGDHNAVSKNYIQELYDFVGEKSPNDLKWYELQKVPMLVHFPQDEYKGVNHTYGGQIDLYPTIANLYNLPRKYMLGNDLLNVADPKVTFRNGSFTDGKAFYISWTGEYYDIKTGEKITETEELKAKKQESAKDLESSDELLNHNLIKKLESESKGEGESEQSK